MKDATHITALIDRSGSMSQVKTDAEGAINAYFGEQAKVAGICTVHLWDFDAPQGVEFQGDWLAKRFDGPVIDIPKYCLEPRGSTALLDAVAMTIRDTGSFLSLLPEEDRPDKVIFIIQTDGEENSSHQNSWETVSALVKEQTEKYNWQFIFLGMGLDTFHQGHSMGVSNVVNSKGTGAAHGHTHSTMSAHTTAYRGGVTQDMSAMAGLNVDEAGNVTNAEGERIDPVTGKVMTP